MTDRLSPRLAAVVEALPLTPSMRVLEVGCGPGAAARAVAERLTDGFLLAVDRSAKAIALAEAGSTELVAAGRLRFETTSVEDLALPDGEPHFDLAFAIRVGALDGRHPATGKRALARLREVLTPTGRLFVDGGDPLRELDLGR